MADNEYGTPSLEVRHVPDYTVEDTGYGQKERRELPGHVHVGVVIGGVFKPLAKFGKAGLDADIERAKQSDQGSDESQQVQPQQVGTGTVEPPQQ